MLASKQAEDSFREPAPGGATFLERALTAAGQRVDPATATRLRRHPTARKLTRLLKTMQGRIDGSFRQVERLTAPAPNSFDHRVTVRRSSCQCRENDQVEMTFEHLTFQGYLRYSPRSCFCRAATSTISQCSASFPFSTRQISMLPQTTRLPVGANP